MKVKISIYNVAECEELLSGIENSIRKTIK